jgi:ATP-dependent Clp protease ATP-binding subunit ClpA
LRRAIEHKLEDQLSEAILRDDFKGRDRIVVTVRDIEGEEDEKRLYFESFASDEDAPETVGAGGVSEDT